MKLTITFNGALVRYTGNEKAEIEIAENACFEDLLFEIGRRYGDKLPQPVWDKTRCRFTHHVLAMKSFKSITDTKEPLQNGDEVQFFLIMAGG